MTSCFLILSPNPGVSASLRDLVSDHWKHVIVVTDQAEIDQLIESGIRIGGAAMHLDLVSNQGLNVITQIRTQMETGPLVIYSANPYRETDEDALRRGASLIQALPVRAEVLLTHLGLFERKQLEQESSNPPFAPIPESEHSQSPSSRSTLEVLRDCSSILACALDTDEMLNRFSGMLRDLIGISKVAVFLRHSNGGGISDKSTVSQFPLEFVRGIAPSIAHCLKLSPTEGTPAWLAKNRKVLDISSSDISEEIRSELELLGVSTAFPLVSRGTLFGVLFLGDRVAGHRLKNHELTLIYHLAEELSLALENASLHRESKRRAELMRQMLERAETGTVLVDSSLEVLQCNPAAFQLLGMKPTPEVSFAGLPQWLQSRLFEQVKATTEIGEKFVEFSGRRIRLTCCSVPSVGKGNSSGAMATIEDQTEIHRARELALKEERFTITSTIAERLTHEILNSVTQLSTYEQLLPDRISEPEFQQDLQTSLRTHTSRVTRLVAQLSYLTGTRQAPPSLNKLQDMLSEAITNARKFITNHEANISLNGPDVTLNCDRGALVCGLEEIIINALQANSTEASLTITVARISGNLTIGFADNGPGFTEDSAQRATESFYTTRNVGLGLGLSVAAATMERIGGNLLIKHRTENHEPDVVVTLPQRAL